MNRTLALLTSVVLVSSPALAQKRLAVIEMLTPPTMTGLGAQVTQNVITTAEKQGYTVNAPEKVRTQLGDKQYQELQQCNGKPACVSAKMQGVVADRVVVGSLDRDEKNYLVKLWLIDLTTGELISDVDRSILIASRRLSQDVNDAVPGLLRGEKEARGKKRITADTKGVSITIDGEPMGKTPQLVELKPGKHELKAEKKAFYPVERYITVAAGETTDEELRMVKIPGQVAEDEVVPALPQPEVAQATKPSGGIPDAAIGLGGAALVLAGGGLGFALDAQKAIDAQGDAYKNTRQYTDDKALTTGLFIGAGAAALGAVIVGLVVDGDHPVQAAPATTPGGGGGVVLSGKF
ncbi:MAG: PEGA domain-containing protein [Myxococcaceae bacterium]